METAQHRDKGTSFLRVFRILETVAEADRPLTVAEIAKSVDLPGPTTHRLCKMLLQERLLQNEIDGKRVQGGPRLFELSGRILACTHLNLERRAILEVLVKDIGETCNITIPDGTRMIYADRVESHWPLRIQLPIGTRVPLHCTASGKLYLTSLPTARREAVLETLQLERRTANTITDSNRLAVELERVRETMVGTDNQEFLDAMVAVAVPIADRQGRLFATLATHAPVVRVSFEQAQTHVPALRRAARKLAEVGLT